MSGKLTLVILRSMNPDECPLSSEKSHADYLIHGAECPEKKKKSWLWTLSDHFSLKLIGCTIQVA